MADLHLKHAQRAVDALKIQNTITDLARRYDPILVMEIARNWVDYMDRQVALNDGDECPRYGDQCCETHAEEWDTHNDGGGGAAPSTGASS